MHVIETTPLVGLLTPSELQSRALALAGIGSWQCDLAEDMLTWSGEVFDTFGIDRAEKVRRPDVVWMYDEPSREELERLRGEAIRTCGRFSMDARIVRLDRTARWIRIVAGTLAGGGRATHLYGVQHDITDERERWEAMRRLAECDALTGLLNRGMFQTRFMDCPPHLPALAPVGALLLFDLDGFKQINDRLGHAAGDHCLRTVAARLRDAFPSARMIARIGGDEFAVLLPDGSGATTIARTLRDRIAHLSSPLFWNGTMLGIGVSAGVARMADPERFDAEATFAAADAALYLAKRSGRGTFRLAGPDAAAA